jgi:hypothetical protein
MLMGWTALERTQAIRSKNPFTKSRKSGAVHIWIAFAVAILISPTAFAFQNEPTGFRNIAWGTSFETVSKELTLEQKDGDTVYYSRIGDSLIIGDAKLKDITYTFYRGRFSGVLIRSIADPGISRIMTKTFKATFGEGSQPNEYMERYIWLGPIAIITLDCNDIRNTCDGIIRSTTIFNEERANEEAGATGAKKDF